MPIANQMSPNLVTKDELRREIDRAILFAPPPVPPMVPRIDLSRLGGGIGGLFSSHPLPEEGGGATSSNPILRENEPKKTEDGHPILRFEPVGTGDWGYTGADVLSHVLDPPTEMTTATKG